MQATNTRPVVRDGAATGSDIRTTESVVRGHLATFLAQKGIAAIVADYGAGARLFTAARVYEGPTQIAEFFAGFISSLPLNGYDRFTLESLRTDGDLAFITWSIGDDVPLGTDTFVVRGGRIVAQTVAMYSAPSTR
jgi:hypothetical protein